MATKKKPGRPPKAAGSTTKPPSKTAFVKSLPPSMPGAEVVQKAKEAGIEISVAYVYGIRSKATANGAAKAPAAAPAAPAKRGPGRPRKSAPSIGNAPAGGLEAAIEAIVERKVRQLLQEKLGSIFK